MAIKAKTIKIKKNKKLLIIPAIALGIFAAFFIFKIPKEASAEWMDENWMYRRSIEITNNTSAETNVYVSLGVGTSDPDKFQADCGDIRFTKNNGQELPYYIESGCSAASTIQVEFDSFPAGAQAIYMYYGNPSAENGFRDSGFSTEAGDYTIGAEGSEETGPGPVGYWKFDEGYGTTAQDSSANNYDGTITADWQAEDMCLSGKCLYFDGTNDLVNMGDVLDMGTNDFTISVWVRRSHTGSDDGIVVKLASDNGVGYRLFFNDTDDQFDASIRDINDVATNYIYSGIYVTDQNWHHYAVSFDRDGVAQMYFDGNPAASESITGNNASIDNDGDFVISYTGTQKINGFVDEVKVYPYVRTDAQIKTDYEKGGSVSGAAASFGGGQTDWMSNGLVGYWKMDDNTGTTTADSSGNSNTGTFGVSDSAPSWTAGKFGSALEFDTAEDYLQIDDATSIRSLQNWTLSAWVKPSDATPSYTARIFAKGNPKQLRLETTGVIEAEQECSGTDTESITSSTLTTDQWTHVTAVYDDSTRKIRIYFDGEEQGYGTQTQGADAPSSDNSYPIYIGNRDDIARSFPGVIEEVRYYNRALSPAEVRQLYEWAPGPVAHWKMDEGTGTGSNAVKDTSGNANHGTTSGMSDNNWINGKYGKALVFDGYNDLINAGSGSSIDNLHYNAFTVSAWIRNDNWGEGNGGESGYVLNKNGADGWRIQTSSDHGICVYVDTNGTVGRGWSGNDEYTNDGLWHHVLFTYDNDDDRTIYLYIDGSEVDSYESQLPATGTADDDSSGTLYIGNDQWGGWTLDGALDDIRIYNYIRTQKQIIEDMNAGHPAPSSPVGSPAMHLKFDEGYGTTAYDSSSNSNDGTLAGSTGPTWTLNGRFDKALDFDGADDYVSVAADTSLDLNSKPSYTVCSWIYPHTDGEGSAGEFWSKGNNYMRVDTESGDTVEVSAYLDLLGSDASYNSTQTINKNTWSHICMVWQDDGDDEFDLYINGVLEGTSSGGSQGPANDSASTLYIGGDSSNTFDGLIDEVKIYNAVLTADQIKADYNQGKAQVLGKSDKDNLRDGLVGYWKLDEDSWDGTENEVVDYSGAGNHGTAMTNGGTEPTTTTGKFGRGGDFDNTDDSILVSASSSIGDLSEITYSAWIYLTDAVSDTDCILSKYANRKFFMINNSGQIRAFLNTDGTDVTSISSSTVPTAQWVHVAATYSDSQDRIIHLFLNGNEVSSYDTQTTGTGSLLADSPSDMRIGSHDAGDNWFFDGSLDEVRIYNRALSPAEVRQLYNWAPGPVAHWKMDEGSGTGSDAVKDVSGNANHGTMEASMTESDWVTGKYGKALDFDGADDYVYTADTSSFVNISNITVSAWAKSDMNDGTWDEIITDFGTGTSDAKWWLAFDNNNNQVEFGLMPTNCSSAYVDSTEAVASISASEWHHLAGTYDGSDIKLYIDGVLENTVSYATGMNSCGGIVTIGALGTGFDVHYFNGQIDDARIYDYARTQEQIIEDMNAGKPADVKPIAWWRLDECSGTTAYDVSGNDNNGTISIGTTGANTEAGTCTSGDSTDAWYNGRNGKRNASLDFDGTDDYVSLGELQELAGLTQLTVSAWINTDGISGEHAAVGQWPSNDWVFLLEHNGDEVLFAVGDSSSLLTYGTTTAANLSTGTWYHLLGVWDGTDIQIYVNGKSLPFTYGNQNASSGLKDASVNAYIGGESSTSKLFNGQIDDVRIYNYALTEDQVKNLYTGGAIRFE